MCIEIYDYLEYDRAGDHLVWYTLYDDMCN